MPMTNGIPFMDHTGAMRYPADMNFGNNTAAAAAAGGLGGWKPQQPNPYLEGVEFPTQNSGGHKNNKRMPPNQRSQFYRLNKSSSLHDIAMHEHEHPNTNGRMPSMHPESVGPSGGISWGDEPWNTTQSTMNQPTMNVHEMLDQQRHFGRASSTKSLHQTNEELWANNMWSPAAATGAPAERARGRPAAGRDATGRAAAGHIPARRRCPLLQLRAARAQPHALRAPLRSGELRHQRHRPRPQQPRRRRCERPPLQRDAGGAAGRSTARRGGRATGRRARAVRLGPRRNGVHSRRPPLRLPRAELPPPCARRGGVAPRPSAAPPAKQVEVARLEPVGTATPNASAHHALASVWPGTLVVVRRLRDEALLLQHLVGDLVIRDCAAAAGDAAAAAGEPAAAAAAAAQLAAEAAAASAEAEKLQLQAKRARLRRETSQLRAQLGAIKEVDLAALAALPAELLEEYARNATAALEALGSLRSKATKEAPAEPGRQGGTKARGRDDHSPTAKKSGRRRLRDEL